MKYDELSGFIKNYIDNDKTNMALMLTAPWGAGKSYYIQNILKPYLEERDCKCVVISLYGISRIQDISKQIYLDLRTIRLFGQKDNKSEVYATGRVVGKTLLGAVTSFAGLNISEQSEDALQKVYESIDLTKKLVVLEDIERSKISIIDILGYVNSLTEHDHVKVLLVANEEEIIKNENNDEKNEYDKDTQTYLRFKEKTIVDTVNLSNDQSEAIKSILKRYSHLSDKFATEEIMGVVGHVNLRTFIYACQKSDELLGVLETIEFTDKKFRDQFNECVFFGILNLAISLSLNYDKALRWKGGKYYEGYDESRIQTSTPKVYLVFRFCFSFLINHVKPSVEFVLETYEEYCKFCMYRSNQTAGDPDITVLDSYHVQTENNVLTAVNNIAAKLSNRTIIPYTEYGSLLKRLVRIKYDLKINIDECIKLLIENIKGKAQNVNIEEMFAFDLTEIDTEEYKEYCQLKKAMIASANDIDDAKIYDFDYNPESFIDLENYAQKRKDGTDFISRLSIEKLKKSIEKANSKELDALRGVFFSAYRISVIGGESYYSKISSNDRLFMRELIEFIPDAIDRKIDKVEILQLRWLCYNLSEMVQSDESEERIEDDCASLRG